MDTDNRVYNIHVQSSTAKIAVESEVLNNPIQFMVHHL